MSEKKFAKITFIEIAIVGVILVAILANWIGTRPAKLNKNDHILTRLPRKVSRARPIVPSSLLSLRSEVSPESGSTEPQIPDERPATAPFKEAKVSEHPCYPRAKFRTRRIYLSQKAIKQWRATFSSDVSAHTSPVRIKPYDCNKRPFGFRFDWVQKHSIYWKLGIRRGDVWFGFNGETITMSNALIISATLREPPRRATLQLLRKGRPLFIKVFSEKLTKRGALKKGKREIKKARARAKRQKRELSPVLEHPCAPRFKARLQRIYIPLKDAERWWDLSFSHGPWRPPTARLLPHYCKRQAFGFRVVWVRRKSFYRKLGLRRGDVLFGVNGIILKVSSILKLYSVFGYRSYQATLQLMRKGKPLTIELFVKKDKKQRRTQRKKIANKRSRKKTRRESR